MSQRKVKTCLSFAKKTCTSNVTALDYVCCGTLIIRQLLNTHYKSAVVEVENKFKVPSLLTPTSAPDFDRWT